MNSLRAPSSSGCSSGGPFHEELYCGSFPGIPYFDDAHVVGAGTDRRNAAAKKLRSYDVNTFLDDPQKDIVTLTNRFATLPDGTNYLAMTVLDAKEKQIQVTTTNSNYTPLTQ